MYSKSLPLHKDPLIHFLVLGTLIFIIDGFLPSQRKEQIIVDQATVEFLVENQEKIKLRKLTPEETEKAIANHVTDEILYREAYRRKLNEGDSQIRYELISKMEGLLVNYIENPSTEELRSFYEENIDNYTTPERFAVDHVFYQDPQNIPPDLLEQLKAGIDFKALGKPYVRTYNRPSIQRSHRDLTSLFGPEAAEAVVSAKQGTWVGPFTSRQGTHFLCQTAVLPPAVQSFADIQGYLLNDWKNAESDRQMEVNGKPSATTSK